MLYGLAHREEEFFADALHKAVLLAPCTICPKSGPESYWENTLFKFPSIGVYHLYGPDWEAKHDKICEELGDASC